MYYIWKHKGGGETNFFRCHTDQHDVKMNTMWNTGKEITKELPIIRYLADSTLEPEDYPRTESSLLFLVSSRIVNILKELNVSGIQYFKSEIVRPNGEVKDNYYTINITSYEDCLDKDKSQFKMVRFVSNDSYFFDKISLDFSKIRAQTKVFHIKESVSTFVHQSVKEAFEREGITGVEFKPL